jgi:hypothetical protein
MAGLTTDFPSWDTGVHRLGGEAGAEAVPGISRRIATDPIQSLFKNRADCMVTQCPLRDVFSTANPTKHRPLNYFAELDPLFERRNRACRPTSMSDGDISTCSLLVGLALADGDNNTFARPSNRCSKILCLLHQARVCCRPIYRKITHRESSVVPAK